MIIEGSLLDLALNLITLPPQLVHYMVWTGLDFTVFEVFRLGPYLPISL